MPRSYAPFMGRNRPIIDLIHCPWGLPTSPVRSDLYNRHDTLVETHYLPDTVLDALLSIHLHSHRPWGHLYKDTAHDLSQTESVAKLSLSLSLSLSPLLRTQYPGILWFICMGIFWGHRHTSRHVAGL